MTVTGFIAPAGEGYTDGYTIARMVISCCAADANPMQLHVAGDRAVPGQHLGRRRGHRRAGHRDAGQRLRADGDGAPR